MRGFIIIPAFILAYISFSYSEHPDSSMSFIRERTAYFKKAAASFNINARFLKAIVFVERTLNYDWQDDALDIIIANAGKNSSIGFCQIKLKTAYWIEKTLSDTLSAFYPGFEYVNILSVSNNTVELIQKLQKDSLNILYAAAYLRIIQSYWQKAGFPIDRRSDIIGTLYSTGLFYPSGEVRRPNAHPKANFFGLKTKKSINLFK
jgi:hypothetical protein